jgi:hypothetical protein
VGNDAIVQVQEADHTPEVASLASLCLLLNPHGDDILRFAARLSWPASGWGYNRKLQRRDGRTTPGRSFLTGNLFS